LPPKVFDCLAYLIERHERAVGRDELVAAVWGKTEITDTLLGQTILKARRAIGDSADEQKAIRTIPRFGYAWVADLADDAASGETAAVPAADLQSVQKPRGFRRIAWLSAIAALAAIGVLWIHARFGDRDRDARISASGSAAVLPVDVSAPAEWSWVRLGLMDAVASRLREGHQPVIPSDNVIAVARSGADIGHAPDVRSATGATLLVAPSATWNDSGWSVHLELQGNGSPIAVDARNVDVLLAGREAADRLLVRLGKMPPADAADPQQWSDAKLLQRVEASLLTDDLDGARRLLQSAPESLQKSPEYTLRLAKIDFRAGEFEPAGRRLRALLAESPVESDPVLRARVLNGVGHVAMRLGHADAATAAYDEAASLLEDRNEPAELGQAYMGRGIAAQTAGRYESALADFSRAHIAFELAGDGLALARVEANEGMLDAARDQYATAAAALARAARRFENFGTLNELAMTTSAEIGAHLALLEPSDGLVAIDRAWPFLERLSNPRIARALAINRALALDANGRRREAVTVLEKVAQQADPEREKTVLAVARAERARIALASGKAEQAIDLALAAVPVLEAADEPRDLMTAWLVAVRALRAVGRTKDAAEQTAALGEWARSHAQPAATLYANLAHAEQQAAERQDARPEYDRTLDLATRGNVPADTAEVAISYGTMLLATRDLERATAVIGQAARWTDRDLGCALLQVRLYSALGQRQAWQHALEAARALAGDREIPEELTVFVDGSLPAAP